MYTTSMISGDRVKAERASRGWRQKDLADKIGAERSWIAHIEAMRNVPELWALKCDIAFGCRKWRRDSKSLEMRLTRIENAIERLKEMLKRSSKRRG